MTSPRDRAGRDADLPRRRPHPRLGDRPARLSPRTAASRRFVFTGDLGRRSTSLLPDPTLVQDIDILVSESTYGNRELDSYDRLMKQLHAIVARATRLQSKIVIPAFSLGRTQRMVYLPPGALRGPQGAADPDLRRQPPGHAPDRDPPRPSRRLHAPRPQHHGQGPALFRIEVRRVLRNLGRFAAAQPLERSDDHHLLVGHVRGRAGSATTSGTSSPTRTTPS